MCEVVWANPRSISSISRGGEMESEKFTVSFDTAGELYTIHDSSGKVVGQRVTPNGTIAELLDCGLSQEDATAQVVTATRLAWHEA